MQSEPLTIAGALAQTRTSLNANGIPDAGLEARSLLKAALHISQTELLTDPDRQVDPDALAKLEEFTERRIRREPLQYITGQAGFFGREFTVDGRVLIPRPETELLIEQALLRIKECRIEAPLILDIGTGSGILAVTVAAEVPSARITAVDISGAALDVARLNAEKHAVADRIEFRQGSLTQGLGDRYDIVLCNPPYVMSSFLDGPEIQPELASEPRLALDGGPNGMSVYEQLLPELASTMTDSGAAYIEIDPPVAGLCLELARHLMPLASVSVLTDLAGLERCLAVELPC